MRKKIIYTAGPMNGLTRTEALNWRKDVKSILKDTHDTYVPEMDGNDHKKTGSEIWGQDYFMLDNSDIILVNMDYPNDKPYIGTSMEISRAFYQNKPIIMFSSHDWVHNNRTFQYHCVKILETMYEAIDYISNKFY